MSEMDPIHAETTKLLLVPMSTEADWTLIRRQLHKERVRDLIVSGRSSLLQAEHQAESFLAEVFEGSRPAAHQRWFQVLLQPPRQVIGRVWFGPDADDSASACLHLFQIDERYRGHGFGRQVLQLVEENVATAGYKRLRCEILGPNEAAQRLLDKAEFQTTSTVYQKKLF